MRLQKRVIAMVMGLQFLSIVLMGVTSNDGTKRVFAVTEYFFFQQQMARLQNSMNNAGMLLEESIGDWGSWKPMYSFMERGDFARFENILKGGALRAQNIDFIVIADTNNKPVVAYSVDDLGMEIPFTAEMIDQAGEIIDRITSDEPDKRLLLSNDSANFLKFEDEIYIFKGTSILKSDGSGPSRGVILAGMNLNRVLREITALLNFPCEFLPEEKAASSGYDAEPTEPGSINITRISDTEALVQLQAMPVIGADTSYMLSAVMPREIYMAGRQMVDSSYIWLACNGITLMVLMIDFLSKSILHRLTALKNGVETIINNFDLSKRMVSNIDDELGDLSKSMNILLEAFEHVIMQIPESLILSDLDGRIVLLNDEARRLLSITSFFRDRDILFVKDIIKKSGSKVFNSSKELFSGEGVFYRADGSTVPVELHESKLDFGPNVLTIFLARDMTEHKNLTKRIDWNEHHDAYTGLPNRKSFVDRLTRLLKMGSNPFQKEAVVLPAIVVLINMDHFKSINAEVTNTGGDIILTITAERIENVLNDRGKLYRTGGDEFTILFTADEDGNVISNIELEELLTKIRSDISMPCQMGDTVVYPSASIGVLFNALSYNDPSLIIEKATMALRDAKAAGLNRITVYQDKEKEVDVKFAENVLRMRYEIQEALNHEQFIPYFQPVYSMETRRLSGFETLVRWQHPTRGFLTPYHFVNYAETIGIIGEIDQQMMKGAIEAIATTPGVPYYFSANGSSNLMQKGCTNKMTEMILDSDGIMEGKRGPDASELIFNMIEASHIDPSRFAVEVTESVLIRNLDSVKRVLNLLREHNIKIFLDDFGTGYSSLQYLHDLPFNVIKLDQSFVRRMFNSPKDMSMIRTIINLANDLGMDTIAEGVETEEQLDWLTKAGCQKAQGYFFAKPLPWSEASALIEKESKLLNNN